MGRFPRAAGGQVAGRAARTYGRRGRAHKGAKLSGGPLGEWFRVGLGRAKTARTERGPMGSAARNIGDDTLMQGK